MNPLSIPIYSIMETHSLTAKKPIFSRLWGAWGRYEDLDGGDSYAKITTNDLKCALPKVNPLDPKGKIFMGSYPGDHETEQAFYRLEMLQRHLKVKTFVSLLTFGELEIFAPYDHTAIAASEHLSPSPSFLSFQIPDMGIAEEADLLRFLEDELLPILEEITHREDQNLYIHCWGGHGRTGILAGILIGILYDLTAEQALEHVERVHAMRENYHSIGRGGEKIPYHSPQTPQQKAQVMRVLEAIFRQVKNKF